MAIIFQTGFYDTFTVPPFSLITGEPVREGTIVPVGSEPFSMKCGPDAAFAADWVRYDWGGTPTLIVFQCRFYVPTETGGGYTFRLGQIQGSLQSIQWRYQTTPNTLRMRQDNGVTPVDVDVAAARDTWHLLEARVDVSANPNIIDWRLNSVAQTQNSAPYAAGDLLYFDLGTMDGAPDIISYHDDWVIADDAADYPLGDLHIPPAKVAWLRA